MQNLELEQQEVNTAEFLVPQFYLDVEPATTEKQEVSKLTEAGEVYKNALVDAATVEFQLLDEDADNLSQDDASMLRQARAAVERAYEDVVEAVVGESQTHAEEEAIATGRAYVESLIDEVVKELVAQDADLHFAVLALRDRLQAEQTKKEQETLDAQVRVMRNTYAGSKGRLSWTNDASREEKEIYVS